MRAPTERETSRPPRSLGVALAQVSGLLVLSAVPLALLWSNPYWVNILASTYLFAALAASWNIIGGFGGQFSLGHGVFFAIGAYTVARLLRTTATASPAVRAASWCRSAPVSPT